MSSIESRRYALAIPGIGMAQFASEKKRIQTGNFPTKARFKCTAAASDMVFKLVGITSVTNPGADDAGVVPFDLKQNNTSDLTDYAGSVYFLLPFPWFQMSSAGAIQNELVSEWEFELQPNTSYEMSMTNNNPAAQSGAFVIEFTETKE